MTRRWKMIGAVALFALALVLLIYATWAFGHAQDTVGQALDAGQLTSEENKFEIASYLMSNAGDYAVTAITCGALGWLLFPTATDAGRAPSRHDGPSGAPSPAGDADDELDDLLGEMPPETNPR